MHALTSKIWTPSRPRPDKSQRSRTFDKFIKASNLAKVAKKPQAGFTDLYNAVMIESTQQKYRQTETVKAETAADLTPTNKRNRARQQYVTPRFVVD